MAYHNVLKCIWVFSEQHWRKGSQRLNSGVSVLTKWNHFGLEDKNTTEVPMTAKRLRSTLQNLSIFIHLFLFSYVKNAQWKKGTGIPQWAKAYKVEHTALWQTNVQRPAEACLTSVQKAFRRGPSNKSRGSCRHCTSRGGYCGLQFILSWQLCYGYKKAWSRREIQNLFSSPLLVMTTVISQTASTPI